MSIGPRRNHSPALKAKVALAAIKGERTLVVLTEQSGPAAVLFWSGAPVRRLSVRTPRGFRVQGRVFAARVGDAVEVVEKGKFGLLASLPGSSPNHVRLEQREDALDGGIVVTVALAAHRDLEPVLAQQLLAVVGSRPGFFGYRPNPRDERRQPDPGSDAT